MNGHAPEPSLLHKCISEFIGTALLLFVGLSIVTLMFTAGSPLPAMIPDEGARRALTGLLFGGTGALIAVSPVGRISGAHINPVVTMGFRLMGRLDLRTALALIVSQLLGAVAGAVLVMVWGDASHSIRYGVTVPGAGVDSGMALLVEIASTFAMISLLTMFLAYRPLRPFTPLLFPPLYAVLSWLVAPISGLSTNPARSFGSAVVSGQWDAWWVYWVGPIAGAVLSLMIFSFLAKRVEEAKLYHFESQHDRFFRRTPLENRS